MKKAYYDDIPLNSVFQSTQELLYICSLPLSFDIGIGLETWALKPFSFLQMLQKKPCTSTPDFVVRPFSFNCIFALG